jgi:Dolichyl-phosphate-mannose-protein mannosyltransferase
MRTSQNRSLERSEAANKTLWGVLGRMRVYLAEFGSRAPSRAELAVITGVAVSFYVVANTFAAARQLWHDELFTYYIAMAPNLSGLFKEIPLDLNPPLNYLAVRASIKLLGTGEIAVRLPAMIAFFAASICLYLFVSKRLQPVYGLLAVLCFWATPFFYYATEARPYALLIFFFTLAMLAWQSAIRGPRRLWSLLGLAGAVIGMALTHLFVIFYILPFVIAEIVRAIHRRSVDLAIFACLLIPCAIPVLFLRTIHTYQAGAISWAWRASFHRLLLFYRETLGPEAPVYLICIAIASLLLIPPAIKLRARLNSSELVFSLGLLTLPILMNGLLRLIHGGFFDRYGTPTGFAYALIATLIIARVSNGSGRAAALSCSIVIVYLLGRDEILERTMSSIRAHHLVLLSMQEGHMVTTESQMAKLETIDPQLPLVAASGLTFLEMDRYEPPQTVNRLYYLTDRQLSLQYASATIFEGLGVEKQHFPIRARVEPYSEFIAQNHRFLVLGTPDYPEDWLIPVLLHQRARLIFLGDFRGPYKDHELFEVDMQ